MTSKNLFSFPWMLVAALCLCTACGGGGGTDSGVDATTPDGGQPDATPTCPPGTELCGDACVNTMESRAHCGGCGAPCSAGEACVDGACDIVCPSTQTECSGVCADTTSDPLNCGGCGVSCTDGEICLDSACVVSCPAAQTACGAVCTDPQSDPAHCGGCDQPCAPGQVCSAGTCETRCATGLTECGAACVDTRFAPSHCGACDTPCPGADGASGLCDDGTCVLACDALEGDCNADLGTTGGDGCETPLATDPANCGACGRVCTLPNAVTGCDTGECTVASCDDGWGDCDGIVENGCETDTDYDNYSCGACGTVCPTGDTCVAGTCQTTAGETCSDAIALAVGANTVAWTATSSDLLTSAPACSTTALAGPDVVLSYTATADEYVTFTFTKPASHRWTAVTTVGACGRTVPFEGCVSDPTATTMSTSAFVGAGETAYVVISDTTVGTMPLSNPLSVQVTAIAPPCSPGAGGILGGGATTRVPTGLASFTEYYVAADTSPTGYVYFGGLADLYRVRKDGSGLEDLTVDAPITSNQLGYAMLIDGANIYTLESSTTGTAEHLFRVSTDGGATWNIQDYAVFPTAPLDDFRALTVHGGRIYLLTEEDTAGTATQIWSVDAAATTLPAMATLELSFTTEGDCNAIARDSTYYYLACVDTADRLVRIPIAGGTPQLVTTVLPLSTTVNQIHGVDTDADGAFDTLYVHTDVEEIGFVCTPGGASPFAATLVGLGGGTANYGLGLDRSANVLWTIDDDTRELVSVQ